VSFTLSPKPRLIYACALGCAASKGKRMSINCDEKWRLLVPLWRNTEAYLALRRSGRAYEGVHRYWRERYRVGGVDFYSRPKRMGIAWQQLRASAALLAEWLKVCWREGWFGSTRRNTNDARRDGAAMELADFILYRASLGVDVSAVGQKPPKKKGKAPPGGGQGPPETAPASPSPAVATVDDDFPF
jgi:hypothetical protein